MVGDKAVEILLPELDFAPGRVERIRAFAVVGALRKLHGGDEALLDIAIDRRDVHAQVLSGFSAVQECLQLVILSSSYFRALSNPLGVAMNFTT